MVKQGVTNIRKTKVTDRRVIDNLVASNDLFAVRSDRFLDSTIRLWIMRVFMARRDTPGITETNANAIQGLI